MRRLLLATAIALLALPALAQASTCQRVGSAIGVHMPNSTDVVNLNRVGDQIYNGFTPCGGATVYNTSVIFISDATPNKDGQDLVGIDLSGGPFAPGTGNSSGGSVPEIGIQLYLGTGDNFVLVTGTDGSDTIRGGRTIDYNGHYNQGLNLNAGAEEQPGKVADPDLVWQQAAPYPNAPKHETFQIDGGPGGDTINLSGGPAFDTAFYADTTMSGGSGDDKLTGGDKQDTLYADAGDDVMNGGANYDTVNFQTSTAGVTADLSNPTPQDNGAMGKDQFKSLEAVVGTEQNDTLASRDGGGSLMGKGGNDLLTVSPNNDGVDGGPGTDTVSYARSPNGVSVDLAVNDKTQQTGAGWDWLVDVENLTGSSHADDLNGDAGPNTIDAGGGADSVNGKGGADELQIRDATTDQATCGAGSDHVVADTQGTDTIFTDCESIDFAPVVQPPTSPPGSDPGSDPGTPSQSSGDHVAPLLTGLKLKKKTISYKLSEPAAVKLRVQRKAGRKWKTTGRALSQKGLSGANKLRFARKLGRGTYRLSAVATDTAGNHSKARLVSFRVAR